MDLHKLDMAVAAVKGGFVDKTCFSNNLETMLYGGFANTFKLFLPQISFDQETPSKKLLAMTIQVICQPETEIEKEQLIPFENAHHIYNRTSPLRLQLPNINQKYVCVAEVILRA